MRRDFLRRRINAGIAVITFGFTVLAINAFIPTVAVSASAGQIDRSATQSLTTLYNNTPGTKALADKAVAVLVFPSIVKGGFIIAGQFVDGALRKKVKDDCSYPTLAASYALQASAEVSVLVVFLMAYAPLQYTT